MQTTLTFLAEPKNLCAKLLKAMIEGKVISEQDFRMNSFRTRISDLKNEYGVPFHSAWKEFTNEFGHPGRYRVHFIIELDREDAIKIYEKVNK